MRDISGLGERSAYGLPDETGVLLLDVPAASPAAKAGLAEGRRDSRLQRSAGADGGRTCRSCATRPPERS